MEAAPILKQFIFKETIDYSMPLCMETAMKEKASNRVATMLSKKRTDLLNAILQQNFPSVPLLDVLLNNRTFQYDPKLIKLPSQSSHSFARTAISYSTFCKWCMHLLQSKCYCCAISIADGFSRNTKDLHFANGMPCAPSFRPILLG